MLRQAHKDLFLLQGEQADISELSLLQVSPAWTVFTAERALGLMPRMWLFEEPLFSTPLYSLRVFNLPVYELTLEKQTV